MKRMSTDFLPGPLPDLSLNTARSNVRVAYQGSPGTVIEAMVLKAFPECIAVPFKTSEKAFEALESSLGDIVVLPIENSYTGSFHQSYDLLLSHNLQIVREVQMDVELCLLALPGVQKDDLQTIFSHPQIISKQNLRDAGVIGSAQAAELYGLNILECNFQDASPNVTRYLVLSTTANLPKKHGQYKTSIVFGLEEGPGILYKALGAFWKREINLTKIESRPNKGKPMRTLGTDKQFNYIFYVDFEASMAEVRAQNALRDLEEIASFLRVLGCYSFSRTIRRENSARDQTE
uniref:Arogenate dehydratase n=1 Tax=Arundo donax TaxID=35708 RepID=A0A0A9DWM4_ARUDO